MCIKADVPGTEHGELASGWSVGSQSCTGVVSGLISNIRRAEGEGKIGGLSLGFRISLPNDKNFQCCDRVAKW